MRKPYSDEYKRKMSERLKGRVFTDEHKRNISKAKTGEGHHFFGKKQRQETIAKRAEKLKGNSWNVGRKHTEEAKRNMGISKIGHPTSLETRRKISEAQKGEKNHNWKNGASGKLVLIRMSLEYRLWRESVFERDNYTCIWCGQIGGKLNADHIKPFAHYPELRFAIDNGRTLCEECHRTTDTFGAKSAKFKPSTL